jgi:L-ascorbate metabolism protein UlaG (beta-lactamase superfamily)
MLAWVSGLEITYLGHATSALEASGTRLLTDPLLRGSLMGLLRRRHATPAVDRDPLDAVLISHVHHDHLDLPSLRRLPSGTRIVVPRGAGALLRRNGFEDVDEVAAGDRLTLDALEVEVVPAVHDATRRGAEDAESVGYLVGDGEAIAYFAGDTELFDGMADLAPSIDLALLPVWGWGPTLGPGHMNPEQAAEALGLLHPRRAVPIHWGTYTPVAAPRLWPWMTREPAEGFAEHAARLAPETEVVILQPGESVPVR